MTAGIGGLPGTALPQVVSSRGSRLRILVITNLFPTERRPQLATFIRQRISAHRNLGNVVEVVALRPMPSRALVAMLGTVGKGPSPVLSTDWVDLPVKIPSLDYARQERSRFPSSLWLERAARRLEQAINLSSFDVIHAHGMYVFPAGALAHHLSAISGLPYAITAHGGDINVMMAQRPKAYAGVLDAAGAVAYVSNALRDRAHSLGAKGENATVIPNGVDCELFAPSGPVSENTKSRVGHRVAFVGNLIPVKGADLLPDIFHGIARSVPNASFVIAGDGPLRPAIEAAMNGLSAEFLGSIPQEQVAQVLRGADLAVLPSRSEGWACVILEAHASGTPMIGSDAGGTAEAIGDPRFVVPQGDDFIERFVETSIRVLSGVVGPRDIRARALCHSWKRIAMRETEMLLRITHMPSETH